MNGKLIVSEGGRERVHELLDEITIVGRGERADLRLRDEKAAPAHCEIRRTPHGFKLVDLESREGTRVNGKHANAHLLSQGDTIAVGAVEMTFLGDSAKAATPKAAAPLREIPRSPEGEPKRFYRHEAKAKSGADAGIRALIGLGTLIVVGAVYFSLSNKFGSERNRAKFVEATELLSNVDSEERAKKILRLLDEIEPGTIDPRDIGRVRQDVKEHLEGFAVRRASQEEYAAWNALADLYKSRPEAADEIVSKADDYLALYPDTARVSEVKRIKKRAQLGADPEIAWDQLTRDVNAAMTQNKWQAAFAPFAKLEANPALRKELGTRVDSNRRVVEDKYAGYVAERFQTAQAAASKGDADTARKIYGEIAAIGVAPHAETAKRALAALK